MPLFAVHALDKPDTLALRLEHYAAHRAFLETGRDFGVGLVMSGPLQSDDGEIMVGSLFIMEAAERATVEAFVRADPFVKEGIWGDLRITRFHRRRG